jgi:hypothetical protein
MPYYGGDPMQTSTSFLMDRLMRGGMSRAQAAAVVGNLRQESGLISNNMNTKEGSYGLMQWRGDRFDALQQYAQQQGKPWTDPGVQADFIGHELNTTEKGNAAAFRSATDVQGANAGLADVIRYKNREEIPMRGAYAQQAFDSTDPTAASPTLAYNDPYRGIAPRGKGLRYGIGGGLGALGAALVQKNYPGGILGTGQVPQKPSVAELGQAAAPSPPAQAQPPTDRVPPPALQSTWPRDEDRFGGLVDPLRYGEPGYGVG